MIIFADQTTQTINYITSPEGLTAVEITSNPGGREWYWVFTDHLGSITTLLRESDDQKFEMSFDPWGNRRDSATWVNYTTTFPDIIIDRGFTGHEHLDQFGLINMNGRVGVYPERQSRFGNPVIARFLSPDPYIQSPDVPLNYNGYAYCFNNPLKYSDPSGNFIQYVLAGAFFYLQGASNNRDQATGKWQLNPFKWGGKDSPGLVIGISTNTSFTNTTYYAGVNWYNGMGGASFGYNTGSGFGYGSDAGNMYFPNQNYAAPEAAAVNSIVSIDRSSFNQETSYYQDFLLSQSQDLASLAMEQGLTACDGCGGNARGTRNLQLAYLLRKSPIIIGVPTFASPLGIYPNPFKGAVAAFGDAGVMLVGAERDFGGVFIMDGKDAGYFYGYDQLAGGASTDGTIGGEIGRVDIYGINANKFEAAFLEGEYFKGWFSVGQGVSGGISVAVSYPIEGVTIVATSFQFGFGGTPFVIPVSGGFNKGIFNLWR